MVNVFNFGAQGDGVNDDWAALQHAIESGDGVLHLNKGTYRITKTIELDLTKQGFGGIRGDSGASRIIMDGAGPAIRIIGDHDGTANPKTYENHTWEKERMPIIESLEIYGRHPASVGIELRKTTKTVITRVLVRECQHGIHLVERNRDFILSDSHLLNNTHHGLYFDNCNLHQIIVHGNHISWNKRSGIKSLNGDVHNLQITGNDIEYNHNAGVDKSPNDEPRGAEIWFDASDGVISEVTIASNTIQATIQPGGSNIRIWGADTDGVKAARLFTISGNVLGSQTRGIEIRRAQRIAVTGNTIYDSKDRSILFEDCGGFAIGSNTFVWRSDDEADQRDGIYLEDCYDGTITGITATRMCFGNGQQGGAVTMNNCHDVLLGQSQILDSFTRGVDLIDCERCRVSDCSIIDRRKEPRSAQAVRVRGGRNNLIQNNMVGGASDELISISDGAGVAVTNHTIS